MRIGILTLPLHTNYGGILQAYALQTILERMGHEVRIFKFNHTSCKPIYLLPFILPFRIWKRFILKRTKTAILPEWRINYIHPRIRKYTQPFIDKHIHQININNTDEILSMDYDAIIVGSDQIWRPSYFSQIENAYLGFTKGWDIKRIAYAVSFGVDYWEYTEQQTSKCKELIRNFDYISIREKSGVVLCKQKFNIQAEQMIDPTCLLTKEDYINLLNDKTIDSTKGKLMACILDETEKTNEIISYYAKQKGLTQFRINADPDNNKLPLKRRIQPSVETWIKGFMNADFIITDSFHGCIFSLIFNKPFIVIENSQRGSTRFYSLLEQFELSHIIVNDIKDCYQLDLSFDYNKINNIMNKFRNLAKTTLSHHLNN